MSRPPYLPEKFRDGMEKALLAMLKQAVKNAKRKLRKKKRGRG